MGREPATAYSHGRRKPRAPAAPRSPPRGASPAEAASPLALALWSRVQKSRRPVREATRGANASGNSSSEGRLALCYHGFARAENRMYVTHILILLPKRNLLRAGRKFRRTASGARLHRHRGAILGADARGEAGRDALFFCFAVLGHHLRLVFDMGASGLLNRDGTGEPTAAKCWPSQTF